MIRLVSRVRNLGIRAQLTLWYIAVFAVLILLFGAIFYVNLRMSLSTSFDSALHLRTEQIAAGITDKNGKIVISDVSGELPGLIDNGDPADTSATHRLLAVQRIKHIMSLSQMSMSVHLCAS